MKSFLDEIAREEVGSEIVNTEHFAVYDIGPAIPQVIRRGILDFGEAEELAQNCTKNGRTVSIVRAQTVGKVIRRYESLQKG